MRSLFRWVAACAIPLTFACTSNDRQGSALGSATGATLGDSNGDMSDAGDDEGDVGRLDTPGGSGDDGLVMGCNSVDFLFLVDDSSSMNLHQDSLVANVPTFIAGLQSTLGTVSSFHVGVLTANVNANNIANCQELGGLVVKTGGEYSSNAMCGPYAAGANYITEADDIAQAFGCSAAVGTDGQDFELPIAAIQRAASLDLQDPGECNEGFLRPDSLLVVILITDEPDGPGDCEEMYPNSISPGMPSQWFDDLVAARGGVESNIVMLTLTTWPDDPCTGPADGFCKTTALKDFTEMFTHGIVGGICEDYAGYFQSAIDVVEDACAGFTPPG